MRKIKRAMHKTGGEGTGPCQAEKVSPCDPPPCSGQAQLSQ